MFQQVVHKGGGSEINYIKIFQNDKALKISVGNIYTGYQIMQNYLDNLHQGGNYSGHIASHQAKLIREEILIDQKLLYISDLQMDHLSLNNSVINNWRAKYYQSR